MLVWRQGHISLVDKELFTSESTMGAHTASTLKSVMSILWQVHLVVANYVLSICHGWWTDANRSTYMERWKHPHDSKWMPCKLQVYAYKKHARKPRRKQLVWGQNQEHCTTWHGILSFFSASLVLELSYSFVEHTLQQSLEHIPYLLHEFLQSSHTNIWFDFGAKHLLSPKTKLLCLFLYHTKSCRSVNGLWSLLDTTLHPLICCSEIGGLENTHIDLEGHWCSYQVRSFSILAITYSCLLIYS